MSEVTAPAAAAARLAWDGWRPPDTRRRLQLALGALWLLAAILQYQHVMFTRSFSQSLAATAAGNPAVLAHPIAWTASLVGQHVVALNGVFATVQLVLALGIAWRPTVRIALAASIGWALAVWWLGEGFGGVLTPAPSPVTGAPGPVILYALLAVLLWPRDSAAAAPFTAARAVGAPAARALWLILWASLAYFALLPANRAPLALHDMITGMAAGEPGWLTAIMHAAGGPLAYHGLAASIVLAVLLAAIAAGCYLPRPVARATLILAIVVAVAIGVIGQALGGILTGMSTDPGSGPLLILLAIAYWPAGLGQDAALAAQDAGLAGRVAALAAQDAGQAGRMAASAAQDAGQAGRVAEFAGEH